jgi:hypothetical protein
MNRCMHKSTALVLAAALAGLGSGASGAARAAVVAPPMAAALVGVCGDKACLRVLPPVPKSQSKSRKRATRRST